MKVVVIPDTNIFLQFQTFYELPWKKLLNTEAEIEIRFLSSVALKELEEHKSGNNKRRQRRARAILPKIREIRDAGNRKQLGPGIFGAIDFARVDRGKFEEHGLDYESKDDRLVLCAYYHSLSSPDDKVVVVSNDLGVQNSATELGLQYLELPELYELRESEEDGEVQVLKKELQALKAVQGQSPKLDICFEDKSKRANPKLTKKRLLSDEEIEKEAKREGAKLKPYVEPKVDPFVRSIQAGLVRFNAPSAEEIERYNREVRAFSEVYKGYLFNVREYEERVDRFCKIGIFLYNDGTGPAHSIEVHLHFPDGFELLKTEPEEPKRPAYPRQPAGPHDVSRLLAKDSLFPIPRFHIPQNSPPPNVSGPNIKKSNSYDVSQHVRKLKHGQGVELHEFLLLFDSLHGAKPFQITYRIFADNQKEIVEGNLNVLVEIDG